MGNAQNKTNIQSHGEAQFFLDAGPKRDRDSRKLNHNTWVERFSFGDADGFSVRFYKTDIVTFLPNGNIVLKSGGFHESTGGGAWQFSGRPSPTTKSRIQQLLPPGLYLSQESYQWFIHDKRFQPGTAADRWDKKFRVPFVDGMLILADTPLYSQTETEVS